MLIVRMYSYEEVYLRRSCQLRSYAVLVQLIDDWAYKGTKGASSKPDT